MGCTRAGGKVLPPPLGPQPFCDDIAAAGDQVIGLVVTIIYLQVREIYADIASWSVVL